MGSLATMRTDRELLAAYAADGDDSAFAGLVARHGRMVYRTCLRALGNEHDAEEAAQAVFLVLARKAGRLRSEGELAAWLHRAARNVAHLALRSRARRSRHEAEATMVRRAGDEGRGAEGETSGIEIAALLDRELDALPAAQRQAVVLRYLEGFPQEEAARVAGCPQGTLARRAQLGLERLRQRFCQRGQVLSAATLAGFLGAEASAAAPAALLPSILAVSKLAAAGAAAGASGGMAATLAEGAVKMMFWAKVKLAAAVAAAVLAVGGGGGAVAAKLLAAETPKAQSPTPNADPGAVEKGIECRVAELVPGGQVKLSAGSANGVREKFEFEVSRDGQPVGTVKVVAVEDKQCTAEIARVTGEIKVGDKAATRFREVAPEKPVAKEEWGQESDGLVASLRARKSQFAVGEPMEFEVVLKNASGARKEVWGGVHHGVLEFGRWVWRDNAWGAFPGPVRLDRDETSKLPYSLVPSKDQFARGGWFSLTESKDGAKDREFLPEGKYRVVWKAFLEPDGNDSSKRRSLTSNAVEVTVGPVAGEAVNGLKLTISADKLEAKAGDAVQITTAFENVSKEDFCVFHFWGETSWELAAPDGESLAPAPTMMPGLLPPTARNYPELKAGGKLSWQDKSLSGNPPSIYVGPGINPRNVYLLKPGTYKLTAVYAVKDGQGRGVAPGRVWAGTVRSNTLEIKLGGDFKAPADAGRWPEGGIPGMTFTQAPVKPVAGAPDEATARRLVLEHMVKVKRWSNVKPEKIVKVEDAGDIWKVSYDPTFETMPPIIFSVNKASGVVGTFWSPGGK